MARNNVQHITSCTISWETTKDMLSVTTRVLPKEIQVRHYIGPNMVTGRIWPLSEEQKQNLFDLLSSCLEEWEYDDYSVDEADGPHWQFKICTKGSCLRTITGTTEAPPHGREIKDILTSIMGEENCYFL